MSKLYAVRRSMEYGNPGRPVDRGQVIELEGMKNDEALVRLGYVSLANERAVLVSCGKCGAKFQTDQALAAHGSYRHSTATLTPQQEDAREDARIKVEDEVNPIYLDKTKASLQDRPSTEIVTKRTTGKRSTRATA